MFDLKCGKFCGSMDNNCYLITDKKTGKSALIDCSDDSEEMLSFVEGCELEYILLTHGHCDHIGGSKAVKEKTGAKLAISEDDAYMLTSAKGSLALFMGYPQNDVAADFYFRDGDVIRLGETEIKVLATPGHTDGCVCFLCGDCLFTGDTLFHLSLGRTDFPTGNPSKMSASLKKLYALEGDYKVYPGHGSFSTLETEKNENADFLIIMKYYS